MVMRNTDKINLKQNRKQKESRLRSAAAGRSNIALKSERLIRPIPKGNQTEQALSKANRALRAISACNQILIRVREEREILERICRVITDLAGYRLAWVGYAANDKTKTVLPMAQSGFDQGYLKAVRVSWADNKFGRGPTGTAIRTGRPSIVRDILHDPTYTPWRAAARQRGYQSSIALPLNSNGESIGVLNIYAADKDAFDDEEVSLLTELADDLAYGISVLRTRANQELAERELRSNEERYRRLFEDSPISLWEQDFSAVKQHLEKLRHQGITDFRAYFDDHPMVVTECEREARVLDVNQATLKLYQARNKADLLKNLAEVLGGEARKDFQDELVWIAEGKTEFEWQGVNRTLDGEQLKISLRWSAAPGYEDTLSKVLVSVIDITARNREDEAMARQTEELARLYRASESLISSTPFVLQTLAQTIVQVVFQEFGQANCSVFLVQEGSKELSRIAVAGPYADQVSKAQLTMDGPGQVPKAIRSSCVINTPDVRAIPAYLPNWEAARAELTLPLKVGETVIGAIDVQSTEPGAFHADDERLMSVFAKQAALTLEHARLYAQTEQRMQNLASLRAIDSAISSSFDVGFTLGILLDQVTKQLGVHAADVLIFNATSQTFKFVSGRGFHTQALQHTDLRLGDGYAGRAARERKVVIIQDLARNTGGLKRSAEFLQEGFYTYVGVPLIAKGQVKGVLEIFQRKAFELDQEQQTFLEMLAGQAAIAIDSAQLFENLQSSNSELMMAYDETIEGWSRAMDLRDKETEGHTQRVTELTLRLAASMGFGGTDLVHIRRGTLLHDIGKIGVPDEILHKPGTLTEEEWVIMRKHPQFAYDMLAPIIYLRPAIDIPYCHHEKWDGTGYPRGLKGEQIPLAARIFAVVDVWDALCSDRPYRKAWPEEKVRRYIEGQPGKHFDPHIVEVFLREVSGVG